MQVISARVISVKAGEDSFLGFEIDQDQLKSLNIADGDLLTLEVTVNKNGNKSDDLRRD